MAEHPTLPMRNSLYRSQVIGKSGSSWHKLAIKLYADTYSDLSSYSGSWNWKLEVFEVDGNSNYNFARSVGEFSGLASSSDSFNSSGAGTYLGEVTLNLNTDSTKYYITRTTIESSFQGSMYTASAPAGNGGTINQASAYSDFESYSETDITDNSMASPGTGFPSAPYGTSVAYDISFQPSLNTNPIWLWYNFS